MSVAIAFYFENKITIMQGKKHLGLAIWTNIISCFGVSEYFLIDRTDDGIDHIDRSNRFKKYKMLEECQLDNPKYTYIYLCSRESIPFGCEPIFLRDFKHPIGDTCYVFGKNSDGFNKEAPLNLYGNNKVVTINTKPKKSLWSYSAASIVLYDRQSKNKE